MVDVDVCILSSGDVVGGGVCGCGWLDGWLW